MTPTSARTIDPVFAIKKQRGFRTYRDPDGIIRQMLLYFAGGFAAHLPNEDSRLRLMRSLAIEAHKNWLDISRCRNMDDLPRLKKIDLC